MSDRIDDLEDKVEGVRQHLLEQEHRTVQIISQMLKPPSTWSDEDRLANRRAFYWSLARFFIPGLGAGSGTGLVAIATLLLLAFQSFTLYQQNETLDKQTTAIVRELDIRVAEAESLRPVLSIVSRMERKALRLANDGTREARIETIRITAPGFDATDEGLPAAFAPFAVYERLAAVS